MEAVDTAALIPILSIDLLAHLLDGEGWIVVPDLGRGNLERSTKILIRTVGARYRSLKSSRGSLIVLIPLSLLPSVGKITSFSSESLETSLYSRMLAA